MAGKRRVESIRDRVALIEKFMARMERIHISEVNFIRSPESVPMDAHGIRGQWEDFFRSSPLASDPENHYYNFYMHVPFCPRKCTFCVYPSRKPRGAKDMAGFVDSVLAEMEFFSPCFDGRTFLNFYAGGGTPSMLEPADLKRVMKGLRRFFSFAPGGMWVIECLPHQVTEARAREFRDLGFNKISFGVQSLDASVLRQGNRYYQPPSEILKTVARTSRMEDVSVNVDLMVGLHGDERESFYRSFEQAAGAGAHYISVSVFQPPRPYVRKFFGGRFEDFGLDFHKRFSGILGRMIEIGDRFGYDIDNPSESKQGWQFIRRGIPIDYDYRRPYEVNALGEIPSSCLGVGEHAKSHLQGFGVYEHESHARKPFDPEHPVYSYAALRQHDEMLRHIFFHIYKSGTLSTDKFRRIFGVAMEERFGAVIRELEAMDMIRREGETLVFTSDDIENLFVASRLFLDRQALVASFQSVDRGRLHIEAGGEKLHFMVGHPHPGGFHVGRRGGFALFAVNEKWQEIKVEEHGPVMGAVARVLAGIFPQLVDRYPSATAEELARGLVRLLGQVVRRGVLPAAWSVCAEAHGEEQAAGGPL